MRSVQSGAATQATLLPVALRFFQWAKRRRLDSRCQPKKRTRRTLKP